MKKLINRLPSLKEVLNIYKIAKSYKLEIIIYTLMAFASTVMGLLSSLVTQALIDFVTKDVNISNAHLIEFNSIEIAIAAVVGFMVAGIIFGAINSRISEKIRLKINTELTAEIFDEFICSKWEFTSLFASGDILNRFNGDIATISSSVIGIFPTLLSKAFQFGGAFLIVLYYDKTMALISLITIPLTLIFSRAVVRKMHQYSKELRKMNSSVMAFNSDALLNMQYLKAFGLVTVFCHKLRKLQREYIKLSLDYNKFQIISTSLMSFVTQIVSYACFGWAIFRLWQGEISFGTLVLFVQLYSVLSGSFSSLVHIVPTIINAITASERITEIRNLPKDDSLENDDTNEYLDKNGSKSLEINFKNVSFKYIDEDKENLKGVDFNVKTGDMVALIGPSGEGKTTLLRLLLALINPEEGEAEIFCPENGESISISPSTRQFFSYVPQKNSMFGDTLAENLRLIKPDATDEEIVDALKLACAYDFVKKEKEGIYCKVGDGGVGFSEGQMQRLSIARAFLRDAPFILLDEATSALDIDTEKQVLENIRKWSENKICIFTSHRNSIYEVCNKIYMITDTECINVL